MRAPTSCTFGSSDDILDKQLRSSLQHPQMLSGPHGEAPYLVLADRSLPMAQVEVDQEAIATRGPHTSSEFISLLQEAGDDLFRVAAYIAEQRVGALSADDGARHQPAMTSAHRTGAVLMVQGVVSAGPSGDKQLRIYAAGILWRPLD
jgi:hypothetical protein